eukprot:5141152-Alexandrium_andersonii.AAC.1
MTLCLRRLRALLRRSALPLRFVPRLPLSTLPASPPARCAGYGPRMSIPGDGMPIRSLTCRGA